MASCLFSDSNWDDCLFLDETKRLILRKKKNLCRKPTKAWLGGETGFYQWPSYLERHSEGGWRRIRCLKMRSWLAQRVRRLKVACDGCPVTEEHLAKGGSNSG